MKLKKKYKLLLIIVLVLGIGWGLAGVFKNLIFTDKESDDNKIEEKVKDTGQIHEKEEEEEKIRLTMVGDFLFEDAYYQAINKGEDKNRYFSLVKDYFLNDDISIGNMEVVIGDESMPVLGGANYVFCAPIWVGDLIKDIGMDVMATANNHAYDEGVKGIQTTLDYFKNNTNIMSVGTFKEESDRVENHIKEVKGIKIGFQAYTMGTNFKIPEEYRYMMNYSRDPDLGLTKEVKAKMAEEITRLKAKADVVIVMMHWGVEFTYEANNFQKEMAQFLNELGVDIIVGSHSHSIQPMEWIGDNHKTLVYYSMGNFVSADNDISRTGEEFDNAYQVGLLSQVEIIKKDGNITIDNIMTEPIINYYDNNMQNFLLVPYKDYDSYEKSHYRYKNNFNKEFITNMYHKVIKEEFRTSN